ncbi:S-methyl-5-thioribose-1-phosphate isomerase [Chloroflexota bacterium]
MGDIKVIEWLGDRIRLLDQTRLPREEVFLEMDDHRQVAAAIRELRIRGAPAIGVAAAYGMALAAHGIKAGSREEFLAQLDTARQDLATTRPTAVNLFWALERLNQAAEAAEDVTQIKSALLAEAQKLEAENEESNRKLSNNGAELIKDGFTILTHCNTGILATAGYGTALGVIKAAKAQGKRIHVFATETRPLLQGARLTAWELKQTAIPFTLVTDNMTGYFLSRRRIDCVIVGADRIASNGDVANKIGTYSIAVLARENGVPFYVAAPTSTIDLTLPSGEEIPIEERSPEEITHIGALPIAPEGVKAANPAFDITFHDYVSAIVTERGIAREPYEIGLSKLI